MKLSAREFQLVAELLTPSSRRFLIKQNGAGVIAELNLNGLTEDLTVLSGTTASVALADDIRAERGDAAADWLTELHDRLRAA
jgi:type IV secretion system protein VirB4